MARVPALTDYELTSRAKAGIFEIWSWIAADSERAADRVEAAIYDACAFVASSPSCGRARRDVTRLPVLFWTVTDYPNYLVVYRPETSPISIVAVLHGKRNLRQVLKDIH